MVLLVEGVVHVSRAYPSYPIYKFSVPTHGIAEKSPVCTATSVDDVIDCNTAENLVS